MGIIKHIAAGLYLGIAAVGLSSGVAQATLIEQDLNVVGDKLITFDDATGLQWLDVDATLGISYNAAELTAFVTAQNFRHATNTEVGTLFTNAGVLDQSNTAVAANFAGATELMAKLGCTFNCGVTNRFLQGWADQVPFSAGATTAPFVTFSSIGTTARAACTTPSGIPCFPANKDFTNVAVGHWLVRTNSVPEPGTLAILGLGLIGLGLARNKQAA